MPSTLNLDTSHPGTVLLQLNRPERLNAINEVMVRELRDTCAAIGDDRAVRVVVLTGAGRGFCSGIDLRDFGPSMVDATAPAGDRLRFQETMAALPLALRALPQPVIAAVNGPAVGGGLALCLAADVRLCSTSASFGNAAILVGLSGAEMGMSYHLPRIVGTSVAADWMLTGRTVLADEAHRRGLVSELVDDDRLVDRALELAEQIAANSPLGVEMTKRALQVNTDAPDLASALEMENRNQVLTHATEEAAAAVGEVVGPMSACARYAVCEQVLRQGSFAADVALVGAAGIGAIGVDAAAVDEIGVDEAGRILDGEGVRVSSYMGLDDILQGDGGTASVDGAAGRLDVAARLGAPGALVATGPLGALRAEQADTICRDWLARSAPLAAERELRIMLEPMHPLMRRWSFVHTMRHALALVDGLAGAGVVVDLGHVWWEQGLHALIREHIGEVVSVQVTNVDAAALAEVRYERAPLDAGDVPVASLVGLFESSGYRGWYENETLVRTPRDRRLDMLRASREWFEAL